MNDEYYAAKAIQDHQADQFAILSQGMLNELREADACIHRADGLRKRCLICAREAAKSAEVIRAANQRQTTKRAA